MITQAVKQAKAATLAFSFVSAAPAFSATPYLLTITNGGGMPLSPGVVYVRNGQVAGVEVGRAPAPGFVRLCQTGDPSARAAALRSDSSVKHVVQSDGPILPGESRTLEVPVADPKTQSIHFETMYGKTKDICAVGSVGSHGLYALKLHVTSDVVGKDDVLQTGAFLDPALPEGREYPDPDACGGAADAVSCLRALAPAAPGQAKVRFFSSYLPSLITSLEMRYGSAEVQSLLIPPSGAVRFQLKLKH